jgi:hypothetical protein
MKITSKRVPEIAMADDNRESAQLRYLLINLSDDYEADHWTGIFGVSKDRLAEAVEAVGHSAANVGAYLSEDAVAHEGRR